VSRRRYAAKAEESTADALKVACQAWSLIARGLEHVDVCRSCEEGLHVSRPVRDDGGHDAVEHRMSTPWSGVGGAASAENGRDAPISTAWRRAEPLVPRVAVTSPLPHRETQSTSHAAARCSIRVFKWRLKGRSRNRSWAGGLPEAAEVKVMTGTRAASRTRSCLSHECPLSG